MIKQGFFITGTDTGIGKTYITTCLLHAFSEQGKRTLALKPVASGLGNLLPFANTDAVALENQVTVPCTLDEINPVCFNLPIAPSIAAVLENRPLSVQLVWQACQPLLEKSADVVFVEGVGGFCVPLNDQETTADLAKKFNFPVILVIGLRLGCLNHALLTYQAILDANLVLAGWIANQVDPHMEALTENVETLKTFLKAPCLGVIPFQEKLVFRKEHFALEGFFNVALSS